MSSKSKHRTIVYVHIQKTCGTSIHEIVKQCPDWTIWRRRPQTNTTPNFITGHIPYGIHNDWGMCQQFIYATFIRDPIDRWKSMFYHALAKKNPLFHRLLEVVIDKKLSTDYKTLSKMDITVFLQWCFRTETNCNIMCKQLSGIENIRNTQRWFSHNVSDQDFGFPQVYAWSGRHILTSEYDLRLMLNRALQNLKHTFDFVGLQANGDADQLRFCEQYDIPVPDDAPYRATTSPRFNEEEWFGNTNRQLLSQINKFDIALYSNYLNFVGSK